MSENNDTVQGYVIKQSYLFSTNRGFALAENPAAPSPFVTWQFTQEENGARDYYWGRYFSDGYDALKDYGNRVKEYTKDYGPQENTLYRYYSTQRPIDLGTFPKTDAGPVGIVNFDTRVRVEHGHMMAWGYLEYSAPLTEKQMNDYELHPVHNNPDRVKMKEQAQTVGKWEQAHRIPDIRRLTWWYPDIGVFVPKEFVTPERMEQVCGKVMEVKARAAEKRTAHKGIAEQLAEAQKQVERGASAPAKKQSKSREDR